MKEQIEKIITKNVKLSFKELELSGSDHPMITKKYSSELIGQNVSAQEITDHVFQFIDWFTGKDSPVAILYGDQKERFASIEKDYTIEELYNFWYDNVFLKSNKG
jgi:hypothetical protein